MIKKADNKIAIPWYRRNIPFNGGDDITSDSISFNLPTNLRPRPAPIEQPVRQPVRVPITEPVKSPVNLPIIQPFPNPIPLPERNPNNPNPIPQPPFPSLPIIPEWLNNPNYDWESHWKRVTETLPEPNPIPEMKTPTEQMISNFLKPLVWLIVANEVKNQYIKVTVTDPIYSKMLEQPVLGNVLREAEKANMDAETVGTILANFDWENGDYKDLEKQLAIGVGVAGAARLMVFIIGRKVVFRI